VVACGAAGVGEGEPFEEPIYVGRDSELPAILADDFDDALPCCVVAVLGVNGWFGVWGLVAEGGELVGVVPFEEPTGGLADHVAGGVVTVLVGRLPGGHGDGLVAARRNAVSAGETAGACLVGEAKQAADVVVGVVLGVAADLGEVNAARRVEPWRGWGDV